MRAVLDPNVVISAVLAPGGSPARVLRDWLDGAFELVVSPLLLTELERALAYPKLRKRIDPAEATALVQLLRRQAALLEDPTKPPSVRSIDPGDDYLIALAEVGQAVIVSGDRHLLSLAERVPVYSPAAFLELLDAHP
jgi:putative PIN family toxin of toxin-antitoxin system